MSATQPLDIAYYLLDLAEREGTGMDPLKLQKLVYLVQGWALAEWGCGVFDEPIEAWVDGPVVPSVYERFPGKRKRIVLDGHPPVDLNADTADLVRGVWERYKQFDGTNLSDMTHEGTPWLAARGKLGRWIKSKKPISEAVMRAEFREESNEIENRMLAEWGDVLSDAEANTLRLTGKPTI